MLDEFSGHRADEERIRYRVVGEPRFESRLDSDGLAIVLGNLIENALKHGVPGAPVDVVLDGTANTLEVANDTEVPLSADALDGLRVRCARGRTAAADGGLGLAIVDAILHGTGLAELAAPPPGGKHGFQAVLHESRAT